MRSTLTLRRRSRCPELEGSGLEPELEPVAEQPTYLVTHYMPKSSMDVPKQQRARRLLDASGRVEECATVRCGACFDCGQHGRQDLAADALWLFNSFLQPLDGTAPWAPVQFELTRAEHGALVFVSQCRAHTLDVCMFSNIDSACLGFVYRGPTDFAERDTENPFLDANLS
jgi:hypothetical protein